MTTRAMMNHKRHNPALILGVVFVAAFLIALFASGPVSQPNAGAQDHSGFSLAAAPLLSSNRIADTPTFHRRSFSRPLAASAEPQFRHPAGSADARRDGAK